jgi:hypothetical protein
MATKKEIEEQVKIALAEIGEIKPWFEKKFNAWIFEHPAYPIGCEGSTSEEVIEKYPLYLKDFIIERLNDNLAPFVEKDTKGHGGKRLGSGRPKGTTKTPTKQGRLPEDIMDWLKKPGVIENLRHLMQAYSQIEDHSKHKSA